MPLLDGYLKSLKPLDIEEPIDVWVHRPLAYLLALLLYPTPVSPNAVTVFSIVCGCIAGASMLVPFQHHMAWAGVFIFLSAVVDCADGQLARMRKTSSAFGRMLDGAADSIVTAAILIGGGWVVWNHHSHCWFELLGWAALFVITVLTGSWHTGGYDYYKNLYLRLTSSAHQDGEDLVTANRRRETQTVKESWLIRRVWGIYLYYIESHDKFGQWFDPYSPRRFNALPPYDEARAAVYKQHAGCAMRWWRSLFGFGSMIFGFAFFAFIDRLEWYLVLRGIGLNIVYLGYLRPLQQRSSKAAFSAMGIDPTALSAQ